MKKGISFLSLVFLFFINPLVIHAQLLEDNSVNILPFWEKGQTFKLKIISTSTDNDLKIAGTNFEASINVIETNEKGIQLYWTYTNARLADNEIVVENYLIANLLNRKIKIQLSDIGQFVGILNYDDIKVVVQSALDDLLKKYDANKTLVAQFNSFKQIIQTKQGLEIAILKHIKFYCFSFGFNFKLNNPNVNKMKMASPFGGQPFDATEKVEMTNLDTIKSLCTTETSKTVVDKNLTIQAIEFIKRGNPNTDSKIIEEQLKGKTFEISDKTQQIINYEKGIPIKSILERTTKLGV
ncbi:MAG: hypothetical protein KGZ74_16620, partial [Chitinophagaceae bacterium]|nr:hypothetical protein [Chitinophagaceae bacterium]